MKRTQYYSASLQFLCLNCFFVTATLGFIPGLYCGEENCYDVLGVTRDSTKQEIAKLYRRLAAKFHPDKVKGEAAKKGAEEKFRLVATAYETLKDEESRRDYDYMLDHPDEFYRHYFNYYRRRVAPKVDVRIVILGTILAVSLFQYVSAYHKYEEAIKYLLSQPKYRLQAVDIAKERGLLESGQKKGKRRREKEEIKEEEESIIRSIIEENIDIKGGHKKPTVLDTLFFQILFLPYSLFFLVKWWLRWIWKFWLMGSEYGEEEQLYLIRKNLGISQSQFDSLSEKEKDEFLTRELWKRTNYEIWKKEKEEEGRRKLAESSQYKRYRRYMRNHGPGQITFIED